MSLPPAFRFLVLVVGGWAGFRLLAWAPVWSGAKSSGTPEEKAASAATRFFPDSAAVLPLPAFARPVAGRPFWPKSAEAGATEGSVKHDGRAPPIDASRTAAMAGNAARTVAPTALAQRAAPLTRDQGAPQPTAPTPRAFASLATPPAAGTAPIAFASAATPRSNRLSGSVWLFLRDGGGAALLPGGSLGGSQAGARVTYRLGGDRRRPIALSARIYAALEQPHDFEAALGVDWQPLARIPLHLLAERRERLGAGGRSDWQLTVYGGLERRRGRLRVDAYGQAGVVGTRRRDLFADGAVRLGVTAGPVELGAGAWGGAQPGASRLDIGPRAGARFRAGAITVRAEADWRFRVAGSAAPGSGPALTLSAGF